MFKSGKNNVINMQLILYTVLEAYHVVLFPHFKNNLSFKIFAICQLEIRF